MFNYHNTLPPQAGHTTLLDPVITALKSLPSRSRTGRTLSFPQRQSLDESYLTRFGQIAAADLEVNGADGTTMSAIADDLQLQLVEAGVRPETGIDFLGFIRRAAEARRAEVSTLQEIRA